MSAHRGRLPAWVAGFLLSVVVTVAHAEPHSAMHARAPATRQSWPLWLVRTSVEYYEPTHADRQIRSTFANALIGAEVWRDVGLDVYGGVTFTGATGNIVQSYSGHAIRYDGSVDGVGPVLVVRIDPLRARVFSLAAEASGAVLFYTSHFPPGGDVYNFAWRLGGVIGVSLDARLRLEAGVHWMHVSNGQGIGPFNPSYEGVGGEVGVQMVL